MLSFKRMYAELALENTAMQDLDPGKVVTPADKRDAARFMVDRHDLLIT